MWEEQRRAKARGRKEKKKNEANNGPAGKEKKGEKKSNWAA